VTTETTTPTEALSLHRCKVCGTRWLLWQDPNAGPLWNLLDGYQRPGSCCDNAPMGEQIEYLRDFPPPTPHLSQNEIGWRDLAAAGGLPEAQAASSDEHAAFVAAFQADLALLNAANRRAESAEAERDTAHARIATLEQALRGFREAALNVFGDWEDCDDCTEENDGCRIHKGPVGLALCRAVEAAEDVLGPCRCGHLRTDHDDCEGRNCRQCKCASFMLPAPPTPTQEPG
jgi:hypothetical protein